MSKWGLAIATVLLGAGLLPTAAGAPPATAGPFPLVTMPSLGNASWLCATQKEMWGLSFRVDPRAATTTIRFRAGARTRTVTLHPGERVRFPVLSARRQRLDVIQRIKPGTLRARLRVEFEMNGPVAHCYSYSPPRIDLRVAPRT